MPPPQSYDILVGTSVPSFPFNITTSVRNWTCWKGVELGCVMGATGGPARAARLATLGFFFFGSGRFGPQSWHNFLWRIGSLWTEHAKEYFSPVFLSVFR